MKKLRNWLIHKLGGYTKEDVRKIKRPNQFFLSECRREVKRMYNVTTYTPATKYIADGYKEDLTKRLLDGLVREFRNTYTPELMCRFDEENGVYEYSIMLEYLVPENKIGVTYENCNKDRN